MTVSRSHELRTKATRILRPTFLACIAAACATAAVFAADTPDPTLVIQANGESVTLSRSALLKRPDVENIIIEDDVSYSRRMQYRAVKMATLMATSSRIADDATVEFAASDGFTSTIPFHELRNTQPSRSIAYLAIEEPQKPWPPLGKGESGGPFYLVWKNPKLSKIGREQWPYHVARVTVKESVENLYPAIQPAADAGRNVRNGYNVYIKNCLPCHQLNNSGPSRVASDLNIPMSPTEYFREGILRKFIRDPQSVRRAGDNPMAPFPEKALSDGDLDALLAYLNHMAPRKVETTRP